MSKNVVDPLGIDPITRNTPEGGMINEAVQTGNWGDPYGSSKAGEDVLGAGPLNQLGIGLSPDKPQDRAIGRTIGTAAATYGIGSALGAGAGAGGAAGGGAADTLGTGITPGAAGASGITPGAAGASGISAGGAAGTALAPGFFAGESASVLPNTTSGGTPGVAGSDVLPPATPAAPGTAPGASAGAAPAGGAPGGTGITPPPSSGSPAVSGLQVGTGGAPTGAAGVEAPGVVPNTATAAPKPTPSFVDQALKAMGNNKLATAGLGLNVLSQVQANRASKSAQDQLNRNAQPVSDASKQLLQEGLSGQVPTAIMQQYQTSFNNRVGEINQRYANMGRDPKTDSAAQQEIAQAKQDMDAQVANYASSLVNQGLTAAGVAQGPQTQAVIAGMQQDKELQQAMAGSLNSIALLQSLQRAQAGAQ